MKYEIEHIELQDEINFITVTQINTDKKIKLRYSKRKLNSKIPQDIGIWKIKYNPKN